VTKAFLSNPDRYLADIFDETGTGRAGPLAEGD
jgi:hypothetical protein